MIVLNKSHCLYNIWHLLETTALWKFQLFGEHSVFWMKWRNNFDCYLNKFRNVKEILHAVHLYPCSYFRTKVWHLKLKNIYFHSLSKSFPIVMDVRKCFQWEVLKNRPSNYLYVFLSFLSFFCLFNVPL